jgi:H+/Na+-translocating ferredoxin:NAD+ oxidoreductase subunit C
MRLFSIRGGVHPADRKALAAERPIAKLPLAPLLHVPLQQHIGAPAQPVVRRGERVLKGQLIGHGQGAVSAPVHAPTSGRVVGIGSWPAHHPSGIPVRTITLLPDGEERWAEPLFHAADPFALAPQEIAARVAAAGVVGMGGATFPTAVKLNLRQRYRLHTLVINAAECEPYLTCDDRLMREAPEEILDGVRIMAHALGVGRVLIGIEDNKPAAFAALETAVQGLSDIRLARLPSRYPMGSEKHLVHTLLGRETPARGLTADLGVVVHNVATAHAVHQALRHGRPLVERVVTVSGGAIRSPANLRAAVGTPVQRLVDHCGGFGETPARLVSGGPMMGQPLPGLHVPVVKGSNGILALSVREAAPRREQPCIRCASCVRACPCGLLPLEMAAHARAGDLEGTLALGLMDCIACGSCAYVCPAGIPLVQYFSYAKGELAAREQARHKQRETRRLAEQRAARMEALQQAKREALARRKQAAPRPGPASRPSHPEPAAAPQRAAPQQVAEEALP